MLPVVASTVLRSAVGVITKAPVRNNTWARAVSGPPRVRISFAEKVAHSIVIFVSCNIIPVIITANIPKYNQNKEEED